MKEQDESKCIWPQNGLERIGKGWMRIQETRYTKKFKLGRQQELYYYLY